MAKNIEKIIEAIEENGLAQSGFIWLTKAEWQEIKRKFRGEKT
jgi:hypothetical protein